MLKSDRFGMETFLKTLLLQFYYVKIRPFRYGNELFIKLIKSSKSLLKSDRFGMEISILKIFFIFHISVKIRPFRYGNYADIFTILNIKNLNVKIRPLGG